MLIKILIVVVLVAIILSLFSGLFHLVKEEGRSRRMVNALTVRIVLSVALAFISSRRASNDMAFRQPL